MGYHLLLGQENGDQCIVFKKKFFFLFNDSEKNFGAKAFRKNYNKYFLNAYKNKKKEIKPLGGQTILFKSTISNFIIPTLYEYITLHTFRAKTQQDLPAAYDKKFKIKSKTFK